ncbi:MAG: serine/threonine-protein kinase [Persicimonas sp.]
MSSTLIELPPELSESGESSTVEYVEASSVEEFAERTHISDEQVLSRVLLPGREFGPYRILGFIASGGMGEIYAAERASSDSTPRQPVALKVISPEHAHDWRIVERFKREASISKAIRSDNVIRVYEYGETDGEEAFLSMELLSGEELFERLCRVRTLPLDQLSDIVLQVLDGLDDVHRSGFIHRDIKPENIFLARRPDGTEIAKVLDFGIAKRRDERSDPLLSVAGQIYGTPEYLAPEQAINPDVDPRADIYSVGVMLYEAATGSLPFTGDTSYSVIAAHQNNPVPAMPSSIDPEFAEIVYTALAKNPADRFQSADEMAQVLRRWVDHTSLAEELPGISDPAFDDVFDSQDLTPSRSNTTVDTNTRVDERALTKHTDGRPARDGSGGNGSKRRSKREKPRRDDLARDRKRREEGIGLKELSDPQFYLDDDAPAEDFEKFSVTRARRRKKRRAHQNHTQEDNQKHQRPQRSDRTAEISASQIPDRRAAQKRPERVDEPTVVNSREALGFDDEQGKSPVAQIVTWIALAAILAAIAWVMYSPA